MRQWRDISGSKIKKGMCSGAGAFFSKQCVSRPSSGIFVTVDSNARCYIIPWDSFRAHG